MQVFTDAEGSGLVWITDLLPNELAGFVAGVGCIYSFAFRNGELASRIGRVASLVDWCLGKAE
jgi:hypothetical protein